MSTDRNSHLQKEEHWKCLLQMGNYIEDNEKQFSHYWKRELQISEGRKLECTL